MYRRDPLVTFGLHNEHFTADIKRKEILVTPSLKGVEERIHYALRIGGIAVGAAWYCRMVPGVDKWISRGMLATCPK
jgi:hypothetical protein